MALWSVYPGQATREMRARREERFSPFHPLRSLFRLCRNRGAAPTRPRQLQRRRGRAARSRRPTPSLTPILFSCTGDGVGVGSDSLDGETIRTRKAIEDFSCPYLFIVLRGLGFVACVRVRWRRRRGGGDAPARGR